jgi:hypothetical protein
MNIREFVMRHEVVIRLGFFFGILAIMTLWELMAPRRVLTAPKVIRWINNIGNVFLNSFLLRVIFPSSDRHGDICTKTRMGSFNYFQIPHRIIIVIRDIMDFTIYLHT